MSVYFIILFVATIFAYFGNRYGREVIDFQDSCSRWMPSKTAEVAIVMLFCFFYAFRWRVGTDFMGYYYSYQQYGQMTVTELIGGRDWGFGVLSAILYRIFNGNYQYYNIVLGIITYYPVMSIYRKHSDSFGFTIFLYIATLGCFWSYNGVRQSLAGSICFGAFVFLYEKKYIKYVVCVLIASLFHTTALIMLPMMLFINMKPWSRKNILITLSLLLSIVFLGNLWSYIIGFLDYMGQEKLVNDYGSAVISSNGVNILRILVALIPVVLSFIMHSKGIDEDDRALQLFENMTILSAIFMFAATKLTVLARFSAYFGFACPLIYAKFKHSQEPNNAILFEVLVCACYILYMVILLPVESNLVPYSFSFGAL